MSFAVISVLIDLLYCTLLHALLHAKPTNQWLYSTLDGICVKWSIYLMSCDPGSSNQMTILLIGVI